MKWFELSIHSSREAAEAISNILHEAGANGIAIEDRQDLNKTRDASFGEVYELDPKNYPDEGVISKAYFPVNGFSEQVIEEIKKAVYNLEVYGIDSGSPTITVSEVNEEDWANAWKKYYKPVKASRHITIIPVWESYEAVESEQIVQLDPGMAFGTGTHPTTRMCIQAIEKMIRRGDEMIDVGAGSGVLSIAAAKLGASSVDALDLDDVAVKSARVNVNLNNVEDIVTVRQNNLLDQVLGTVDLVVGNLLSDIILRFPADAAKVVKPGGCFIASGIIKANAAKVKDKLITHGFMIEEQLEEDGWTALIAQNGR